MRLAGDWAQEVTLMCLSVAHLSGAQRGARGWGGSHLPPGGKSECGGRQASKEKRGAGRPPPCLLLSGVKAAGAGELGEKQVKVWLTFHLVLEFWDLEKKLQSSRASGIAIRWQEGLSGNEA